LGEAPGKEIGIESFFLRKLILSFPNQSGEWLVRGRRAQQLGVLAVSRRKSFCWGTSMCLRTCKLGRERPSFAEDVIWWVHEISVGH